MYKKMISCAILAFAINHCVQAADTPNRYEELTVTSSRITMPLRQVGTSLSVLDATQIEEKGYTTVADILRSLPSIGVSNSGGLGKQTTLRVRGEEGFRTKVYIDGVDVSDPTGTQAQPHIQHLSSANIERIEVLRGPQGMMYGADAGGVINIITKQAEQALHGDLSIDSGRYNSHQFSGNIRGNTGSFDYSLLTSALFTDGFNARTTDTDISDNDGYNNTNINFSLGFDISDNVRLQGLIHHVDSNNEFDQCFVTNVCEGNYTQNNYKVDAIVTNGSWEHILSHSFSNTKRDSISNNTNISQDVDGELQRVQYLGVYHIDNRGKLVYGIDWRNDTLNNLLTNNSSERDQTGLYLEWQGNINNRFFYTAGARHDDNDDVGTYTSYRATSAYLFPIGASNELKFKASYGTGFRAPSLFELFFNIDAMLPALERETSKGYDLGIEFYGNHGLYFEAIVFRQQINNEIDYDFASNGYLQKSGDSQSEGVEISFEIPIMQYFILHGNYTYNDTQNAAGRQRVRRPEQIINLGARVSAINNKLTVNANLRQVNDAIDRVFDPIALRTVIKSLQDYEVVDINISYAATTNLSVYIRGENIFDKKYQEIINYNTSGAAAYAGFRLSF